MEVRNLMCGVGFPIFLDVGPRDSTQVIRLSKQTSLPMELSLQPLAGKFVADHQG